MPDYPQVEKVRILLAEHATLRAEIIARVGHAYQMMAVLGGALVLLVGVAPRPRTFWILFVIITAVISLGFWTFVRDMKKCAARIREIELDVNDRAQEDLMVWENLWGGDINGYFGHSPPRAKSHLQKLDRPIRTFRGEPIQPPHSN